MNCYSYGHSWLQDSYTLYKTLGNLNQIRLRRHYRRRCRHHHQSKHPKSSQAISSSRKGSTLSENSGTVSSSLNASSMWFMKESYASLTSSWSSATSKSCWYICKRVCTNHVHQLQVRTMVAKTSVHQKTNPHFGDGHSLINQSLLNNRIALPVRPKRVDTIVLSELLLFLSKKWDVVLEI